ncbi:hypothetical protein WJX84_005806 [Apatococcus fuscideae]|uniref:Uncharacterized protein n=1 Tax=Apatococcus fuscideae TaxID=2026836 RepID=A0AAW1T5B6_9CHLO
MTFESHKPNNQTATLATHARRTFTGFPAVLKRSVKSGKVGSQRAVCTEAVQKQASSPKHPVAEKRPSGSTAAPGFFEAETNNKRVKYSEDLEPITPTNHLESDIQAPRQSKAAQVFQSFFETDHIRDEEIRLICRRDRAVGVFAMVFWSLAAEGVGQGSASIAQAALSTAVLRFKDLKAFQDKLEAKQKKGAASAQAWFDDLAAQAKDQYEIFQASATEVSELASRKIGWKKSYAGLQNWLKPIVDPPASQPGRWTSWAAPRPVKKRAPAEQPQPVNLVFAAPAGGHSFKGEPKQGHKSAAAPEQRSQEQTPVFQASAAAATAKKLESAAHPVPAALEPSKEEQGRAILDKETQRKKTGTTEVDDTSQLWLAAAKAADTTRTAEGRTTTPSKAWSAEGRQPGVPATAEAAAASGAQREAMQVRRPEQHHVTPHEKPTPQKEAAFAAANRPDTSHNPTAVAKSEMQPLKVAGSPSDQQSGHPQDTLVAASTRDAYTIQNKQAKEQPAKSHNPTSQLWMRAAAAAETARRAGTNSSTPASPATNGAKEPQHRSYSPATDTATATSQATSHKTPEQALHNIKTEHSPTHGISRDSNGMPPSVSTATIGRADDAPTTPGKRTLGALQQDRAAGRPSGQEAARQVKTGAGIALGGGGGDHSGGSSGGRGGGSGGGGSKKRRTGSGGGNEWVQPHRPSWHHWVLLILLFTAGALAVLSLRTAHDNREQNNQVKMRGGSLGLIAASIFLTFECGWPGA